MDSADTREQVGMQIALPASHCGGAKVPSQPTIIIEGGHKRVALEIHDLWTHRDLFYFLVWRDVKVRYKQTVLGAAWAILQPFLTMVVFTVLFGRVARLPSDGEPYAIFSYAALLPWSFLSLAVTNSGNSLVGSANLITKVYFPRLVIPGAAVGAALVDLFVASAFLFVMMPFYNVRFSLELVMFVPLVILTAIVALGIGMWTSALNVKYRDVRYAVPFLIQLWMFVTPIIYPLAFIPRSWRWVFRINPLTGIFEAFRDVVFARKVDWTELGFSTGVSLFILIYAVYSFKRMEHEFADVI
jgi:lipopolysaccharide transport system permease protein